MRPRTDVDESERPPNIGLQPTAANAMLSAAPAEAGH